MNGGIRGGGSEEISSGNYWDSLDKPIMQVTDPARLVPSNYRNFFNFEPNFLMKYSTSKVTVKKRVGNWEKMHRF